MLPPTKEGFEAAVKIASDLYLDAHRKHGVEAAAKVLSDIYREALRRGEEAGLLPRSRFASGRVNKRRNRGKGKGKKGTQPELKKHGRDESDPKNDDQPSMDP